RRPGAGRLPAALLPLRTKSGFFPPPPPGHQRGQAQGVPNCGLGQAFAWLKAKTGADLAPEQADAVKQALTRKVAVLTGGPGCGKSFTVRSVIELAKARGAKIVLAAPTGRAAKRLAELTGHEAATIHRLLKL